MEYGMEENMNKTEKRERELMEEEKLKDDMSDKLKCSDCGGINIWEFQWHHTRSEEHTSELQSRRNLVCRLLLEKKKIIEKY